MKKVVIYKSKYGSTEKYAKWLSEALTCDLVEQKKATAETLKGYDVIIYSGGIYAGSINGLDLIVKNYSLIKDKEIIVVTCGLADPNDSASVENIMKGMSKSLTPEMMSNMKFFHVRGAMNYGELTFMHRSMMAMFLKMLKKKDEASMGNEEKEVLNTFGKDVDFTDKVFLQPILDYVDQL